MSVNASKAYTEFQLRCNSVSNVMSQHVSSHFSATEATEDAKEERRLAEEAEQRRLAEEAAEAARLAEEERIRKEAEEAARKAEQERLAWEAAEAARKVEEDRLAREAEEAARQAELARIEAERLAEEAAKKAAEELRLKMERVMLVLRGNSEAATREMAFGSWRKVLSIEHKDANKTHEETAYYQLQHVHIQMHYERFTYFCLGLLVVGLFRCLTSVKNA